jgi:hypothetical protein
MSRIAWEPDAIDFDDAHLPVAGHEGHPQYIAESLERVRLADVANTDAVAVRWGVEGQRKIATSIRTASPERCYIRGHLLLIPGPRIGVAFDLRSLSITKVWRLTTSQQRVSVRRRLSTADNRQDEDEYPSTPCWREAAGEGRLHALFPRGWKIEGYNFDAQLTENGDVVSFTSVGMHLNFPATAPTLTAQCAARVAERFGAGSRVELADALDHTSSWRRTVFSCQGRNWFANKNWLVRLSDEDSGLVMRVERRLANRDELPEVSAKLLHSFGGRFQMPGEVVVKALIQTTASLESTAAISGGLPLAIVGHFLIALACR